LAGSAGDGSGAGGVSGVALGELWGGGAAGFREIHAKLASGCWSLRVGDYFGDLFYFAPTACAAELVQILHDGAPVWLCGIGAVALASSDWQTGSDCAGGVG